MEEKMEAESPKKKEKAKKAKTILFKVNKKGLHVSGCMSFLRICILPFVRLVYPFKYVGNKNAPKGACIYVSNHYRMIDPMYVLPTTKEGVHFIAKKETETMPILGFFVKKVKTICVSRDGNDARAILDGLKCLKNGEKLAIYPEGQRNKTDEPFLPFKSGSALFAIRAKVPVVPMVIYKKARFLQRNYILMGEPFELSEYYGVKLTEEVLQEADGKIMQAMLKLRTDFEATQKKRDS